MAGRIPVSCVESGHEGRRKREIGALEPFVRPNQLFSQLALLLIQDEESLRSDGRDEEEQGRPRGHLLVAVGKYGDNRREERDRGSEEPRHSVKRGTDGPGLPNGKCPG